MISENLYREIIGQVFSRHYSGLYKYGLKISCSEDLAKDAIQELFVSLWNNRRKFEKISNPESYLYRSLRNNLLREMKSVQADSKNKNIETAFQFSHEELLISEEETTENAKLINQRLNSLPPRQKEILFLRFYNNLSYNEIADVLDITYKTVKNLTYTALKTLRDAK